MEWIIAMPLIAGAGYFSWKAGLQEGEEVASRKINDTREKRLKDLREKFGVTKSVNTNSSLGIEYVNYELYDIEIGPLVVVKAEDLIDEIVRARLEEIDLPEYVDVEDEYNEDGEIIKGNSAGEFIMACEKIRRSVAQDFVDENKGISSSVKARLLSPHDIRR